MHASRGPLDHAARNLRQLGHSPASWSWALAILAIQSGIAVLGHGRAPDSWFAALGLSREGFLSGRFWQLGSYGLLHGSWAHVWVNALFVLLIGSRIEHMTGRPVMVATTAAGVVGGGLGHLLLGSGLLVGLSGGCIALLLLLTTVSPQSRFWPVPVSGRSLGLGVMLAGLLLALINPGLGMPGCSVVGRWLASHGFESWFSLGHACHFGGGLAGWMAGRWVLRPRVSLARLRRDRARREPG